MRLSNAIMLFLAEWPAGGAAKATVRDYRKCLDWFCAFAAQRGAVWVTDLTPSLVRTAAIARMEDRSDRAANFKGGEASAAQMVAATRCLARWLLAEGLSVESLATVKAPHVPERIQPRLFADEFERLESTILRRLISGTRRVPRLSVSRDLALLHLLGELGLRAQEVCGLQLGHVDLERGEVFVAHGKRRKERVLSIVGDSDDPDRFRVVRLLDDWIAARAQLRRANEHEMLWTSIRGNPLNEDQLRHVLARMCIEAGLGANRPPHSFRRYVFTEHYRERPGALPKITARMGWAKNSHQMVNIYARGAELEFAREPMPLLNGRPKSTVQNERPRPILITGASLGGGKADAPALPTVGTRDRDRRASANLRRGSRLPG